MKKRFKRCSWFPGIYEGKTPEQIKTVVGTAITQPKGNRTPDSFIWQKLAGRLDRGVHAHY
jgi:hypothetical protein